MRTAVVTGAGSGLGRAIAAELIERGYRVHVTDADAAAADRAAAELGDAARGGALDVRDETACRALAESIGHGEGLDLWVNNAGVLFSGPPWEQSADTRQTMLDVNATGLMNGTVAALGPMRAAGRGQIINVVSLAGIVAAPGEVAYSASKHAAIAFTLGTLFDLRRTGIKGIQVSAICPDGIWTPDARGQARRPRRRPILLWPPAHRRRGGKGGRRADRPPAPDPHHSSLARANAALLRPLPPAGPADASARPLGRPPEAAGLQKEDRSQDLALSQPRTD
jgi:NAD(P)-dependent dehydrogenase (short-subunit alcohol dehydrogenase family)